MVDLHNFTHLGGIPKNLPIFKESSDEVKKRTTLFRKVQTNNKSLSCNHDCGFSCGHKCMEHKCVSMGI